MVFNFLITIIFSSLLFAACCTCGNSTLQGDKIPESIKSKADSFIISKTGEDFFNNYIKPDYDNTTKIKNGYLMVYNFSMSSKEGVEGIIRFSIDTLGNVQNDKEIAGIPDCSSNKCDYKISRDEAKSIAKNSGLDEGIKEWDVEFTWDNKYQNYVWQVRSTLTESKDTGRSSGKTVLIEPVNGNVLDIKEWRIN